jgi:hypothetical protein
MTENTKMEEQQVVDIELMDATKIKGALMALGHIVPEGKTTQETVELLLRAYNEVAKNSYIVLAHTLQVYQSLAARGKYPEELMADSKVFKGRQGFEHIEMVFGQLASMLGQKQDKKAE